MSDLSELTITGNIGSDPEQKRSSNGRSRVVFRVANNRYRRARNPGEQGAEEPTWYQVTVFSEREQAFLLNHATKGSFVVVTGAYDQTPRSDGNGVFNDISYARVKLGPSRARQRHSTAGAPSGGGGSEHQPIDNDDDIPF